MSGQNDKTAGDPEGDGEQRDGDHHHLRYLALLEVHDGRGDQQRRQHRQQCPRERIVHGSGE
jgi:hypothetical protein